MTDLDTDALPTASLGVPSLAAAFQRSAARDPGAVALRTAFGGVEITWQQYADRVGRIARGLASLGVGRGSTVATMMVNRPEFNLVDTAVLHLGAASFGIYNTLPAAQITHLFGNAGNHVVVCERQFVHRVRAAAEATAVEHIVCIDADIEGTTTLAALEMLGDQNFDLEAAWQAVGPDDLATIIYTSGTTGPPKGVEMTHGSMLDGIAAMNAVVEVRPGDRLISYLPSAHLSDRFFVHYMSLAFGAQVTCVDDPMTVAAVLPDVRPTSWSAVPRIWEKLKAAIEARIAGEPDDERRRAMRASIDIGIEVVRVRQAEFDGGPCPDAALLEAHDDARERVLDPLRAAIGLDQTRWALTGAAPIGRDVLEFFFALGVPVIELWGMSESALGTINPPDRVKIGTVGRPVPTVELRIAEDGELLMRHGCLMRGYRNDPERTAEAVDPDGWLHTGDVAEIDDDGYVRIVDRKKELIINAGGKNMSPANIENAIKASSELIAQAVAVGDRRPYNVALLTLNPLALGGRPPTAPDVQAEVTAAVDRANEQLARVEQIKRFRVVDGEWMPGGDELTPTMKLKRRPIAEKYAALIDALYADA